MEGATKTEKRYGFNNGIPSNMIGAKVYRMSSTGHGSDYYGACECCGKHVSETFIQVEGEVSEIDDELFIHHSGCKTLFGHENCLVTERKINAT